MLGHCGHWTKDESRMQSCVLEPSFTPLGWAVERRGPCLDCARPWILSPAPQKILKHQSSVWVLCVFVCR